MQKNSFSEKIILAVFLVLCLNGCTTESASPETEDLVDPNFTLSPENYAPSLELSGSVVSDQTANLSTKIGGRIENLFFETGDRVTNGTLLGNLTSEETAVNANTATQDSTRSLASYNAQINVLNEQVAQANEAVKTAEIALEEAQNMKNSTSDLIDEQVKLAEKNLDQAKTGQENVQKITEQRLASLHDTGESVINGSLVAIDSAYVLSQNLADKSDHESFYWLYEDYLGATETITRTNSLDSFKIFAQSYDDLHTEVNLNQDFKNYSLEDLYIKIRKVEGCLVKAQDTLRNIYLMLQASSGGVKITETQLSALKSSVLSAQANVESTLLTNTGGSKTGVRGWLIGYDEVATQNQAELSDIASKVATAEQALAQAQSAKIQQQTSLNSQVRIAEQQLAQARQALTTVGAQKNAAEIQYGRDVNASSGTAKLSQVNLENAKITAPFDGVITAKLGEIGQVVGAGTPIYQLSNDQKIKVEAYVPDKFISDLSVGLKAQIGTGNDDLFWNATLQKIEPNLNPVTHKLKVEFVFDEGQDLGRIKLGQFAKIKLSLTGVWAFFVPNEFVFTDFDGSYIIVGGAKQRIEVLSQEGERVRIYFDGISDGIILNRNLN